MSHEILSKELVSSQYVDLLRQDLSNAKVCRFLIAFVSGSGLDTIETPLCHALRDQRSFGVSSLTCECGYQPFLELQDQLGRENVRLKYFMDPKVPSSEQPSGITLFHSKVIYIWNEGADKSIVYIGSHNWSNRALGPGGTRNVEISVRFESRYSKEHLTGAAGSIAGDVNRHLLSAWEFPACLNATRAHEEQFRQWTQLACARAADGKVEKNTIILAVRKQVAGEIPDQSELQGLRGRGLYLQALDEGDGQSIWDSGENILVLVWQSVHDLQRGRQPVILKCRESTHKAGPNSARRGTNRSAAPIAGFAGAIYDEAQLRGGSRSFVTIWSGRDIEVFDFEFPTKSRNSSDIDGTVSPNYQFHLEVEFVVFPKDGITSEDPDLLWGRESFAVAKSRRDAKYEKIPGYLVNKDREYQIRQSFVEMLGVNLAQAKALPVSEFDVVKVGKRYTSNPLHETFLGPETQGRRDEIYESAGQGSLLPELDNFFTPGMDAERPGFERAAAGVKRVQRVYTGRLADLSEQWSRTAAEYRRRHSH